MANASASLSAKQSIQLRPSIALLSSGRFDQQPPMVFLACLTSSLTLFAPHQLIATKEAIARLLRTSTNAYQFLQEAKPTIRAMRGNATFHFW